MSAARVEPMGGWKRTHGCGALRAAEANHVEYKCAGTEMEALAQGEFA